MITDRSLLVVIDSFSYRSLEYDNVTLFDYGILDQVAFIDNYYDVYTGQYSGYGNYDDQNITADYGAGFYQVSADGDSWDNATVDLDFLDSGSFEDPFGYTAFYDEYLRLTRFGQSPEATVNHGDWVVEAINQTLDSANSTEILAIDVDLGSGNFFGDLFQTVNYVFDGLTYTGSALEKIVSDFFQLNDSRYSEISTENFALAGISMSIAGHPPNANESAVLEFLASYGIPFFQSAPNVNNGEYDWSILYEDVISVGAWNQNDTGALLVGSETSLTNLDIVADGTIEKAGWGTNFGTSFATPKVATEWVNVLNNAIEELNASGSNLEALEAPNLENFDYSDFVNSIIDLISTPISATINGSVVEPIVVLGNTIEENGYLPKAAGNYNGLGYSVTQASAYVENTPATFSSPTFFGSLITGTTVSTSISYSDPDGNSDGIIITGWFLDDGDLSNGIEQQLTDYTSLDGEIALDAAWTGKTLYFTKGFEDDLGNLETSWDGTSAAGLYRVGEITTANREPTGSLTIIGNPWQGQTLSAEQKIEDEDGLGTLSYQWLRNGTEIAGATENFYTVLANDNGSSISVRAQFVDDGGTLETVTSDVVAVSSNASDTTPPELVSLSISSSATTEAGYDGIKITVNATINDDLSGNAGEGYSSSPSQIRLLSPSGEQLVDLMLDGWLHRVSGDAQTGTYEDSIVLPEFSEIGDWTVESILLVDQVGNMTSLRSNDLALKGLPTSVTVSGGRTNDSFAGPETGAILTASKAFDQREVGFPSIKDVVFEYVGFGDHYTFRDKFYEDTGAAMWREDGVLYLIGGAGSYDWDVSADIVSGALNGLGLWEFDYIPSGFAEGTAQIEDPQNLHWLIENAQIDAGALYEAYKTSNTGDELSLINAAFSGNDTFHLSGFDDFAFGFAGDDKLYGGDGDDTLDGGDGDDTLDGGDGDDEIYGGDGNDIIYTSAGNDIYDGGVGIDTVITDYVNSPPTLGGNISLRNIENQFFIGETNISIDRSADPSSGDNHVKSQSGDDRVLLGVGDDTFELGSGKNYSDGGSGNDKIILEGNGTFDSNYVAFNVSSAIQTGTEERLNLNGKTRFEDVMNGGADVDTVELTDASDAFFLHDSFSGFHSSLTLSNDHEGKSGTARIENIENINAGDGDDIVDLTSSDYSLAGQDITVDGGAGNDALWGSDANETLNGGGGNDTLFGGAGINNLIGGLGADEFQFTKTSTNDTIADFNIEDGDTLKFFSTGSVQFDRNSIALNPDGNQLSIAYGSGEDDELTISLMNAGLQFSDLTGDVLVIA